MAFENNINDLKILFVLLIGIPLIATTNIDCGGKSFHCLNSTHFMICVDVGGGVSYTVDDIVIPCPFPTVCLRTNRFECEFLKSTTAAPTTVLPVSVIKEKETTTEEVIVDTLAWNTGPEQHLELSTVATLETTTDATVLPLRPVTTSNDSISTTNTSESSTLTATEILEITTLSDQNFTGTGNEISTLADINSILATTDTPAKPFTTYADLGPVPTISDTFFINENVLITTDILSGSGTENFEEALTGTESVINLKYDVNATEAVFVNNSDISTNKTVQDNILLTTPTSATYVSSVQDTTEALLSERYVSTTEAKVMHSNTTDNLINYETTTEHHLTMVANVKNNVSEIKPKILEVMTTTVPVISTTEGGLVSENSLNETLIQDTVTETILNSSTENTFMLLSDSVSDTSNFVVKLRNFSDTSVTESTVITTDSSVNQTSTLSSTTKNFKHEKSENITHLETNTSATGEIITEKATNILNDNMNQNFESSTNAKVALQDEKAAVILATSNHEVTHNTIVDVGTTPSTVNMEVNKIENNYTTYTTERHSNNLNKTEVTTTSTTQNNQNNSSFNTLVDENAKTIKLTNDLTTTINATEIIPAIVTESKDVNTSNKVRNDFDKNINRNELLSSNLDTIRNISDPNEIFTTDRTMFTVNKEGNAFDLDSSSSFVNQSAADPIIYENVQNNTEKVSNISIDSSVLTTVETTTPLSSNTEMKTENNYFNTSLTYDNDTSISTTSINDGGVNYTTQDARTTIDTTTTTQATKLTADIILLKNNSTLEKQELVTTTPSTPVIILTNSSARQVTEKHFNNLVQPTTEAFEVTRNTNNNTSGFEVNIVENILFNGTENSGLLNIFKQSDTTKISQNNVNKKIGPPPSPVLSRKDTNTLENGGTKQIINTLTDNSNAANSIRRGENTENGLDANFEHNIATTTVKMGEIEPTGVLTNFDQSIATTTVINSKPEMTGVPTNLEQSIASTTEQNDGAESTGTNTNSNQNDVTTTLQNETAPIDVLTILEQSTVGTTLINSEVELSDGLPTPRQSFPTTTVQNDRAEQTGVLSNSEQNVTITKVSNVTEQIVVPKNLERNFSATTSTSIGMLNNSEQSVASTTVQKDENIQTVLPNSRVQSGGVQSNHVPTISEQNVSATTTINNVGETILFLNDSHHSVDTTTIRNYGTNGGTIVGTERIALISSLDQGNNTDRVKNVENMSEQSIGTSTIQKNATLLPVDSKNNIVMIPVQGETGQNRSMDNSVPTVAKATVLNKTGQAGSQGNSGQGTVGAILQHGGNGLTESKASFGQGTVTATFQHDENGVTGSEAISGQRTVPTIAQSSESELTEAQANPAQSIVTDLIQTGESGLPGPQANSEQSTVSTTIQSVDSVQTGSQAILGQSTDKATVQQGESGLTGSEANPEQSTVQTIVPHGESGLTEAQANPDQDTVTDTLQTGENELTLSEANSEHHITVPTTKQSSDSGLTGPPGQSTVTTALKQGEAISRQSTVSTLVQQYENGLTGLQANFEQSTSLSRTQRGDNGLTGPQANSEKITIPTVVRHGESGLTGTQVISGQSTVTATLQQGENGLTGSQVSSEQSNVSTTAQQGEIELAGSEAILGQSTVSTLVQQYENGLNGLQANFEQSTSPTTTQSGDSGLTGPQANSEQTTIPTTIQSGDSGPTGSQVNSEQGTILTTAQQDKYELTRSQVIPEQGTVTATIEQDDSGLTGLQAFSGQSTVTATSRQGESGLTGSQVNSEQGTVPTTEQQGVNGLTGSQANSEQSTGPGIVQRGESGLRGTQPISGQGTVTATLQQGESALTGVQRNPDQGIVTGKKQQGESGMPGLQANLEQITVLTTIQSGDDGLTGPQAISGQRTVTATLQNGENGLTRSQVYSEQGTVPTTAQQGKNVLAGSQAILGQSTVPTIVQLSENGLRGTQTISGQDTVKATLQPAVSGLTESQDNSEQVTASTTAQQSENGLTDLQVNPEQGIGTGTMQQGESRLPGSQANSEQSTVTTKLQQGKSELTASQANSVQGTITTKVQEGKNGVTGSETNFKQGTVTATVQQGENKLTVEQATSGHGIISTTVQHSETGLTGSQLNIEHGTVMATVQQGESEPTGLQPNSEKSTATTLIQQSESGLTGITTTTVQLGESGLSGRQANSEHGTATATVKQGESGLPKSQIISEQGTITTKVQQGESEPIGSQANLEHSTVTTTLQHGESGLIGSLTNFEQGTATATVQQGESRLTGSQANSEQDTISTAPLRNGQSTTMKTAQTKNKVSLTNTKQLKYNINRTSISSNVLHLSNGTLALSNEDHISTILVEVVKTTISADGEFSTNAPSKPTTITYNSSGYSDGKVFSTPIVAAEASGNPDENTINLIKEKTSINNILNSDSEKASYDNVPMVTLSESSYTSKPKTILNNNASSEKFLIGLHPNLNSGKSEGTDNLIYASKVTTALPGPAMDVNKNVAPVHNPPHLLSEKSSLSDYSIQDYAQAYAENANTGVVTESLLNDNNYNVATARTTPNIMNISDISPQVNTSDKNSQDQYENSQSSSPENVPVLPSKPLSTNILEKALMMTTTSYVQVEQSTNTPSFVEVTTKIIPTEATDKTRNFKIEKTVLTTAESFTDKSIALSTNGHRNILSKSAFDCQSRPTGKYADSKDCSKFYLCSGTTQTIVGSCPVNTVFSDIRKQCTRNLSHCIRNNEFKCSSAGRYADYLKPNVYYICIKKEQKFLRYKLQCQKGYLLNKLTVTCYKNSQPSRQSISNDNSSSTTEKISQEKEKVKKTSKENINDFECEEEGKFADPNNCRGYYVCKLKSKSDESYQRKYKKCDEDEIFHKEKRKCVDAGSYECRYCDSLSPNIYYVRVKTDHHILTYKLQCQDSFYLNNVTVRCEKKSEPSNQSESSDISTSTNEKKSQAAKSKSNRSENRERFECQKVGKFSDPNNCRKYYLCKENNSSERSEQEFRRKHKRCGRHEVFAEEKKACVYSRNNKCIFDRRD